jgi:putative tricarboxylic transport membrane protein
MAIKAGSQMLRVPRNILMPAILLFCVVGSFAINNTTFDVSIMLATGVLAYFMEANGIPATPAVLGLVLGRLLEENARFFAAICFPSISADLTFFMQ